MALKPEYRGQKFRIVHCQGAYESFEKIASRLKSGQANKFARGLSQQIQRLADGQQMTKENFPKEGKLPNKGGNSKHFRALKRIPVRGYCWLSSRYPNTYFISHYVYKDYGKLDSRDTQIVHRNWKRIEEEGDER